MSRKERLERQARRKAAKALRNVMLSPQARLIAVVRERRRQLQRMENLAASNKEVEYRMAFRRLGLVTPEDAGWPLYVPVAFRR